MRNFKEQLVPFEIAKFAFNKGYPVYNTAAKSNFYNRRTETLVYFGRTGKQTQIHLYSAPTQSLLQKWLREEYGIIVKSIPYEDDLGEGEIQILWEDEVIDTRENPWLREITSHTFYHSYEEALKEGLLQALKLIK